MDQSRSFTRRELLHTAAVAAGSAALGAGGLAWAEPISDEPKLPARPFGKTGRSVCMLSLGTGQVAGRTADFNEAVDLIRYTLDAGITFIDTAKGYQSEPHVGKAIADRRKEVFLATKTGKRDYDGAMRELEDSLEKLGTDYLDLWMVHSVGSRRGGAGNELARLRAQHSVMKAMRKAKEQGVVKLSGFTGHASPEAMLPFLEADDLGFEAVLSVMSASSARGKQRDWEKRVLPAAQKKGLGLIAMKVFGAGRAVGSGEGKASAEELLSYVWDRGVPVITVGLNSKAEVDTAVAACKAYAAKKRPEKKPSGGGPEPNADVALRERFRDLALPFEEPGYVDGYNTNVG